MTEYNYPQPAQQPHPQQNVQYVVAMKSKSHVAAILLSLFFGVFGVDRFYLGHIGMGISKLLFGWLTLGIWPLVDFILIITKGTQGLKQIHWT